MLKQNTAHKHTRTIKETIHTMDTMQIQLELQQIQLQLHNLSINLTESALNYIL
jgi:hypothetical protein